MVPGPVFLDVSQLCAVLLRNRPAPFADAARAFVLSETMGNRTVTERLAFTNPYARWRTAYHIANPASALYPIRTRRCRRGRPAPRPPPPPPLWPPPGGFGVERRVPTDAAAGRVIMPSGSGVRRASGGVSAGRARGARGRMRNAAFHPSDARAGGGAVAVGAVVLVMAAGRMRVVAGALAGRVADVGRMISFHGIVRLISRSIALRFDISSRSQKLTAAPDAPARAVRPMRCTYVSVRASGRNSRRA